MIAYRNWSYTYWCPRIDQVSNLERHKFAHLADNLIYFEKHITRKPLLYSITINIEVKM